MPLLKKTSTRYYTTKILVCQIGLILLVGLLVLALAVSLWLDNTYNRGVAWGPELPRIPRPMRSSLGVNLFLDREPDESRMRQALETTRELGAHWVKQLFPWEQIEPTARGDFWDERYGHSTWEHYDRIVRLCEEAGLELIVRLDRPPPWARQQALAREPLQAALWEDPDRDITGPPDDLADYGDFVHAVVSRYRGQVHYIQIWNEPNLANEWNWAAIDPEQFVALLRIGYTRAKEADPDVVILFPSLAPNDGLDPRHMSDLEFLHRVYEAGGGDYFDVMSAQLYGLGQPPSERSPLGFDRSRLRLLTRTDVSRVVLLREVMEQHGDGDKPIWVGELGWNATPPDWTGQANPWGRSVSEETKGRYIVDALNRSLREWPWMGVHNLWFLYWSGPPPEEDDPTIFFALVKDDFTPLPAYDAVHDWASAPPPLGVGYHELQGTGHLEDTFWGTRLDLVLPADADPQSLRAEVDGTVRTLHLWQHEAAETRYIVAEGLRDGQHTILVEGPSGLLQGCFVIREQPLSWLFPSLTALLSLGLIVGVILLMLRLPAGIMAAWAWAWRGIERFRDLPERQQALVVLGGTTLSLGLFYIIDLLPTPLTLLSALFLLAAGVLLALLRLDWALIGVILVIPLYAQPARIAGRQFSLFELAVLACLVAAAGQLVRRRQLRMALPFRLGQALPALAFLLVCAGSLLWSTDHNFLTEEGVGLLRISLREFRVTVVEPLLLYPLLVLALSGASGTASDGSSRRQPQAWRFVDALVLSGVLVGLGGIVQVFVPSIPATVADGVRRASSVYGTFSSNNLALFLGRVLPLAVAGGLFLPRGRRSWLYLVALAPLGGGFLLTISRGGFIALAAVCLLYGLIHSRVLLWLELAGAAGGVLLIWVMGGMQRLLALDTLTNRRELWRNSWVLVRERPWLGLGLDAYYHHYHRLYPLSDEAYWNPNNLVLEFWTRLGLLGLLVMAWLYGAFFVQAGRLYRRLEAPAGRVLALGLLGSVAYALVHGLVDGAFFAPDWAATFWLAYGLVAVLREG